MKIWVYLDGRQQGPFEINELLDMPVDENTKVWHEGLPRWCAAGEVPALRFLFDGSAPSDDATPDATAQSDETPGDGDENVVEEVEVIADAPAEEAPASRYAPGQRYQPRPLPDEPCPSTYLGLSIFLAICCCSPLSIGALVASICVTSFYQQGNVPKARKASEWAAWLIMLSIALGFMPAMLLSSIFGN